MSIICQDVALMTTTTVRTIVTIIVSTVLSQGVGLPTATTAFSPPDPITSFSLVPSASCSTYVTTNLTTSTCSTAFSTLTQVITPPMPAPPPAPTQVQIPTTITSQYFQTQFNTIMGSSCRTIPTGPSPITTTPGGTTPPPTTTSPPAPGITDTTYTTEYVTVTGSDPPDTTTPISTSNTRRSTSSSGISRSTVYYGTSDPISDPTDTAIGAASTSPSSASSVPIGAIAGGVAGGIALIALLGLLAYFVIFKKSVFAPKGYERPVGEEIEYLQSTNGQSGQSYPQMQDQYSGSTNAQSGLYPQIQEQGGYHTYENAQGYGQQTQTSSTAPQSLQYSDLAQPQPQPQGSNPFTDSQGSYLWQNMGSGAAVAALPAGAAAAVVLGQSSRQSNSSNGSPASYTSFAPLLGRGSRHQQQSSQGPFLVPYRGYAEPVDDR